MRKIWALLWLLILTGTVFSENYAVQYYNYEDGLPSELIKQTAQDSLGFIWIATDGGLVRFDGLNFIVLDEALPSRYVKNIWVENGNRLLVCTDLGLVQVTTTPITIDTFTLVKGSLQLTDSTLFYPKAVYKDRQGRLWISEPNAVVCLTSPQKLKRYTFPSDVESGSYLKSFFFFEGSEGPLFVISQSGHLFRLDAKRGEFKAQHVEGQANFRAVDACLKLDEARCLIGTPQGVFLLTFNATQPPRCKKLFNVPNVQALALDTSGKLWIGTSGGGLFYAPNFQQSSKVYFFDQLDFKVINHLLATKDGQIWVSSDNGLALIYQPFFEKVLGFSNYAIQNLAQEQNGSIWATDGLHLFKISTTSKTDVQTFRLTKNGPLISSLAAQKQKIALGLFNGKVKLKHGKRFETISLNSEKTIFSLTFDRFNDLWLTLGDAADLIHVSADKTVLWFGKQSGVTSQPIVVKYLKGKIWLGARGNRSYLFAYSAQTGRFENKSVPLQPGFKHPVEVYDMALSNDGSIVYLASNWGLITLTHQQARVLPLQRKKIARSVVVDPQNRVWLGTDHGAYCFVDTIQIYFDDLAGFKNQTFAFRSAAIDGQGRVYFGTYDGIYRQQSDLQKIQKTLKPQIVDLIVDEEKHLTLKELHQGLEFKSTLRVVVSALMYPAHKIEYQWRMPGVHNSWSEATTKPELFLSNLPIGTFTLQIRARQIGKAWSPILNVPLNINAPWYLSKWLMVLVVSIFVLIILISTQLIYERRVRKQIAGDLEKSEFQLKTIANNTPIILFMIDNNGTVTFAQGRGLKELEEEFRPVEGLNLCQNNSSKSGLEEDCRRVLQGDSFESIRKLGNKYYRFWFSPIKDSKQRIKGALGVAIDITELKETETRLRHAIIQAETSNKAKSEFIANMSHEIRTPLNAIIGLTDLMDQSNLTENQKEFLQTVKFSARELLKIINQILDFSKIESGKMELEFIPFDLKQLVQNIANAFTIMARQKGLQFKLEWDESNPQHVVGDPTRLGQILINLLGNATKFTQKGSVTLKVLKQNETEDAVDVLFVVQDTGIGIPKDKVQKIFGSFEQVDSSLTRKYGGTGLGLTITSRLIEMMGSKIEVESEENKGTTFKFELTFPKVKDQKVEELPDFSLFLTHEQPRLAEEVMKESQPEPSSQKDTPLILLVEDNVINQRVAKRMVENMGYKVEIANHGKEALEMLDKKKYDLILLDVQMPVLDGLRTAQKIRVKELNTDEHIPIIAMTAHAQKEDRDRCLEAGMDDYLSKPINMKILEEKIKHYLKK